MSSQISNDTLAEVFDVEPTVVTQEIVVKPETLPATIEVDTKHEEFKYVRENLHSLIDAGTTAIANALAVAHESQHPRAYEVAGNLIKNIGDLTDKLVNLEKVKHELSPKDDGPRNVNIDKAVFVGSTADLLKAIKKNEE